MPGNITITVEMKLQSIDQINDNNSKYQLKF